MLRPLLGLTIVLVLNRFLFTNGEVELVNDWLIPDSCAGKVQVRLNGTWGAVCEDVWDVDDAAVVCKELECGRVVFADIGGLFGERTDPVILSKVNCVGNETSLTTCSSEKFASDSCLQRSDAGVVCTGSIVFLMCVTAAAVLFVSSAVFVGFLVRMVKKRRTGDVKITSRAEVVMSDLPDADYEIVDFEEEPCEDQNSDDDYINVMQEEESEDDYVNVKADGDKNFDQNYVIADTDGSEDDYVNLEADEHQNYDQNYVIAQNDDSEDDYVNDDITAGARRYN